MVSDVAFLWTLTLAKRLLVFHYSDVFLSRYIKMDDLCGHGMRPQGVWS